MLPTLCLWMSEGKIYKNGKKKGNGNNPTLSFGIGR